MKIETTFPTNFAIIDNVLEDKEHKKLIKYLLNKKEEKGGKNWSASVYTTHGTYDLSKDQKFKNLINKIEIYTTDFSKKLGSYVSYKIVNSWYNIYYKGDFQEYHDHQNVIFSAVYFFTNPKGSGKLTFKNPIKDMLPLRPPHIPNELSFFNYKFNMQPNSLIIFRSYLDHMVEICHNTKPRITAAFNLK
jgi:uncharacterized protein (TIGR02466 family)